MTFEQQWIEFDYNPFILFNANGKILTLNSEAQYLMGAVDTSTIFEIATAHASTSFGFNTTFIDLEFGRFKFFGITVGYANEEEIGIRLYQLPSFKFSKPKDDIDLVNVYALIDLCISSNSIGKDAKFVKDYDPTIPDIRVQADAFIKFLNKIYAAMGDSKVIKTQLSYRIGEYIRFEDKKYGLIGIDVTADSFNEKMKTNILAAVEEHDYHINMKKNKVSISLAMITD